MSYSNALKHVIHDLLDNLLIGLPSAFGSIWITVCGKYDDEELLLKNAIFWSGSFPHSYSNHFHCNVCLMPCLQGLLLALQYNKNLNLYPSGYQMKKNPVGIVVTPTKGLAYTWRYFCRIPTMCPTVTQLEVPAHLKSKDYIITWPHGFWSSSVTD